jgi:TetR/AcrR family transcriptional regulator
MGSGRRTSLSAREKHGNRSSGSPRPGSSRAGSARVAPLYKRLPHGPHRLDRNEVILHQRTRIHGAMIEAVARHGYEATSVKEVIELAGVSRRSFYEQFANKEAAFLVTFDLIARRDIKQMRRAFLSSDGSFERRLRAAFDEFAQIARQDRNATILTVLEAQRAGLPGVLHLRKVTSVCEQMLARGFADTPGGVALPMPLVRGIGGGLHGIASAFLREQQPDVNLSRELVRWTLHFQTPAVEGIGERMAAGVGARMREIASAYGNRLRGAEAVGHDERTRVLQSILRLAAREEFRTLSVPQIADEANVSIDAFCEMFEGRDDCFTAALDMIGDELLMLAADPALVSDDWPRAVRRVLAELMRYLADHPLHARTLVQEAFFADTVALERVVELSLSIATLLTEGAPVNARERFVTEAVAGAIWHTVRCQVAVGRVELLPALADHLAYVVLTPFIGAQAAGEIVTETCEPVAASRDACATGAQQIT